MPSHSISFLQANLNHSAGAQDLFVQSLAEWSIDVGIVAEPYRVPDGPNWFRSGAASPRSRLPQARQVHLPE